MVALKDSKEIGDAIAAFQALGVCNHLSEAAARLGWKRPTSIQEQAIPHLLQGKDVIGLAETGSGKTGAFALPILQGLLDNQQDFYALVLSPTRELAVQIAENFEGLGSGIGVRCAVLVGGIDMMNQSIALAKRPHIVVGTPGRVVDHLSNTKGFHLKALKHLVLDEADRLLTMDFEKEIDQILKVIPKERRTQLFSATMTSKVAKLQRACLRDPVKVEVSQKYQAVKTLRENYLFIPAKYKETYLAYILSTIGANKAMIFTKTCEGAQKLALMLRNLGLPALALHGHMSQAKRLGAMNKFKALEQSMLLATDLASRGLDVQNVDLVVNYDVPNNTKDYTHRVGRTARAGKSGLALTMVTQYDVEVYTKIEQVKGVKLEEYETDKPEVLLLHENVQNALSLAVKQVREKELKKSHKKRHKSNLGNEDDADPVAALTKKFRKKY